MEKAEKYAQCVMVKERRTVLGAGGKEKKNVAIAQGKVK